MNGLLTWRGTTKVRAGKNRVVYRMEGANEIHMHVTSQRTQEKWNKKMGTHK